MVAVFCLFITTIEEIKIGSVFLMKNKKGDDYESFEPLSLIYHHL